MDSFWTTYSNYIIGIPTAILAILAVWISLRQWKKKRLEYSVIANESLLSYHDYLREELIIFFKNKKIKNLTLLHIEFENAGNEEILESDFYSQIIIYLGEQDMIIKVEIDDNMNLGVKAEVMQNTIHIDPLLLNPKDKFSLKILIDKEEKNMEFYTDCRIAGVEKVRLRPEINNELFYRLKLFILWALLIIYGFVFVAITYSYNVLNILYNNDLNTMIIFLISVPVIVFSFAALFGKYFSAFRK